MRRIVDYFYDEVLVLVLKVVGLIMVLCLLAQVLSRLLMPVPLAWTEELCRFLFIIFSFLGAVFTLRRGQHLGISFVYDRLPRPARRVLAVVIDLLVGAFGLFLLIKGLDMIDITWFQKSTVMRVPMKYLYSVFPIMGAMFALHSALHAWDILTGKAEY